MFKIRVEITLYTGDRGKKRVFTVGSPYEPPKKLCLVCGHPKSAHFHLKEDKHCRRRKCECTGYKYV